MILGGGSHRIDVGVTVLALDAESGTDAE
jgi:hypothetical protein